MTRLVLKIHGFSVHTHVVTEIPQHAAFSAIAVATRQPSAGWYIFRLLSASLRLILTALSFPHTCSVYLYIYIICL